VRALVLLVTTSGCGGAPPPPAEQPKLLHSAELNDIMKNEVNEPFSALTFLVFHAEGGELDFARISLPASSLRLGVAKVRAIVNPPVQTNEAREVFFTYVDSLVRDSESLVGAVGFRDRAKTEAALNRISDTCNNCHHFFRLRDIEENK
jgi:hypothetical protein